MIERIILISLLTACLCGCGVAHRGASAIMTRVNNTQITITEGVTTTAEVVRQLGEPDRRSQYWMPDGRPAEGLYYNMLYAMRSFTIRHCKQSGDCITYETRTSPNGVLLLIFIEGVFSDGGI